MVKAAKNIIIKIKKDRELKGSFLRLPIRLIRLRQCEI